MDVRPLRYMVTVANLGSFTRAAEKLGIAQPPLSRQIQQLEQELGVILFERKSRPLALTSAGRFVYERAQEILERIEAMQMMSRRLGKLGQGRFAIGFVGSTLYGALPEVLRRLRLAYPALEIELKEMTTLQQAAALKRGEIEVGFGRLHFEDAKIQREVLREEALIAAVPIGHPLLNKIGSLRLAELAAEPLIIYPNSPRPSYADQVLDLFRKKDITLGILHEVSGLQTALGLVAAGIAVCLVPECVQQHRREDVIYRPIDDESAVSPIIMSYRSHDQPREFNTMLELIRESYRVGQNVLPAPG